MYQGGFAAREDAEKKKEEYLMGKSVDKLPEHGPAEAAARVSTPTRSAWPVHAQCVAIDAHAWKTCCLALLTRVSLVLWRWMLTSLHFVPADK